MSSGWKYGLIKVAIEDEGADYEAQINLLVELYPLGDNGEYSSFCLARLQSIEEIQNAQKDIEHDGINEWFYDNGVFEWKVCSNCAQGDWDWIRSKRVEEKEKHSPDCEWHKDWHACNCGMLDNKRSFTSDDDK